ncbi:MAG: carbohydrate binding domain-containing protein, partial [Myxococcota bacterium]|nr:carbohydrate binding domain-containing protein [Myxococcota bacterium]
ELTRIFGETLTSRFGSTDEARVADSTIIHPKKFAVYYNKKQRTLLDAVNNWAVVNYGSHNAAYVLKRVKKALHDNEPVFVSWMVDFNALEYDSRSAFYGSFNMETLVEKGAFGRTGGHMTVLEDYQAIIKNADGTETVLKAGVTLDPKKASDKALLDKALENSARIVFFRTKNSWGGEGRTGLPYAPGPYSQKGSYEKGYHDLYMTYLDAPFATVDNCPDFIGSPDCATYASKALQSFVLPPEFFTDGDPEEEDTDDTTGDDTDSGDDQSDPNNLIANGGFEKGPVTTGWTTIDNGIALAETTDANTGLYAAEVTVNTPDQANTDMRQIVSVIAGKTYIISVAVKNSSRSVRARLVVGASYGSYSSLANEQWQVFSYSYKAIATGNIEVGLRFYDDAGFKTGDRVIVDSFSMTIEP